MASFNKVVVNAITGKRFFRLPVDWDYRFVIAITVEKSHLDYSIKFSAELGADGQRFCEERYKFNELKSIAAAWAFVDYEGNVKNIIRPCIINKSGECFFVIKFSVPENHVGDFEKITAQIGKIITFHNSEMVRLHREFYSQPVTPAEQQYYRDTWGIDATADRLFARAGFEKTPNEEELYRYEAWYPLLNDPPLHSAGVEIGAQARVVCIKIANYSKIIKPQVRIVFRKGVQRESIECVHILIDAGNQENLSKKLENKYWVQPVGPPRYARLSVLEHFVAIKSYVASIAEMGLVHLLWEASIAQKDDTDHMRFGFNPNMQWQLVEALNKIAPSATTAIKRDWLMQLVETVPPDWISSRAKLLVQRGLLSFELGTIQKIFPPDWLKENESTLRPIIKAQGTAPWETEEDEELEWREEEEDEEEDAIF